MFNQLPEELELKIYKHKNELESKDFKRDICNIRILCKIGYSKLNEFYLNCTSLTIHDIKKISNLIFRLRISCSKFNDNQKDYFELRKIQKIMLQDYSITI